MFRQPLLAEGGPRLTGGERAAVRGCRFVASLPPYLGWAGLPEAPRPATGPLPAGLPSTREACSLRRATLTAACRSLSIVWPQVSQVASIGSDLAADVGPGAVPPQKIQAVPHRPRREPSAEGQGATFRPSSGHSVRSCGPPRTDWRSLPHSTPLPGPRTGYLPERFGVKELRHDGR